MFWAMASYFLFPLLKNMFYSRKVYLKPDQQEENYQSFDHEVCILALKLLIPM